jgi:peptidoglycan hydrolase-like protein with peptidoglycan-binding domain
MLAGALSIVVFSSALLPALSANAVTTYRIAVMLPSTLSSNLPLVRLHFSSPTKARRLPPLVTKPFIATKWEQISPNDVQAVATVALSPSTNYTISAPTRMSCSPSCAFTTVRPRVASVATNLTWEAQLLAELNYLPLTFTPGTTQITPSEEVNGTFTWAYPSLPSTLSSQWTLGTDNVILRGALDTFQSQNNLPVTGEADATTWSALVNAANNNRVDPATYNYVDVSESLPETLTLYQAGKVVFTTLVNTGIEPVPTELGTYPVYERFFSTTMSGTNPNGTKYVDPDIPWVSYFNGGDALHGFIRSSYGFPQSLGCVEMPFASAKTVFPYTPIGTLVTVRA